MEQNAKKPIRLPLSFRITILLAVVNFYSGSHQIRSMQKLSHYQEPMSRMLLDDNMAIAPHAIVTESRRRNITDRMLFGIFSYDGPNEGILRRAHRETYLNYYRKWFDTQQEADIICSLQELQGNQSLMSDSTKCRFLYTFVLGGGVGDPSLRKNVELLDKERMTELSEKTRCLYEDPECGGTDIEKWTLSTPECNISESLEKEWKTYQDITFLSIPENHELGKTDTWMTYSAMLTRQIPGLQISFIGKLDSDQYIDVPLLFDHMENNKKYIEEHPHLYAGYTISREACSRPLWGKICTRPEFKAPLFVAGAMVYLSTDLAQHVFLNGTSLATKQKTWYVGEDMQLANMVYSDPNITVHNLDYQQTGGANINIHPIKDVNNYRSRYSRRYRRRYGRA